MTISAAGIISARRYPTTVETLAENSALAMFRGVQLHRSHLQATERARESILRASAKWLVDLAPMARPVRITMGLRRRAVERFNAIIAHHWDKRDRQKNGCRSVAYPNDAVSRERKNGRNDSRGGYL